MVVTPGATAYLLTDRFPRLIAISVAIGAGTSFIGAYASYFLDGATGGIIVVLQTLIFLTAFVVAPKHGMLAARRQAREAFEGQIGMIDTLFQPFAFAFMQQAFIISLLVALPMALLSCFLVLKGWSLMGDAISHAVLPGIVVAYIVGIPLAIGAFVAGMVCALATGYLKENSRIKEDTVMGIVFSGMFGLGIVLYTKIQSDVHLDHILFGDILGLSWGDVLQSGIIAVIAAGLVLIFHRDLLLHAFDAQHARAIGLPIRLLHYGLLSVLSLTIVGALKAVGIILAIAMLIAPGAIAFLLTNRFERMLLVSVAVAVAASFLGVYASFFLNSAPAPTIVLLMSATFVAAFFISRLRIFPRRAEPVGDAPTHLTGSARKVARLQFADLSSHWRHGPDDRTGTFRPSRRKTATHTGRRHLGAQLRHAGLSIGGWRSDAVSGRQLSQYLRSSRNPVEPADRRDGGLTALPSGPGGKRSRWHRPALCRWRLRDRR